MKSYVSGTFVRAASATTTERHFPAPVRNTRREARPERPIQVRGAAVTTVPVLAKLLVALVAIADPLE